MSNASDPFSILNRNPERGLFNLPKPKPKVVRYIPGKAPVVEDRDEEEEDDYSAREISHYTFDNDKISVAESNNITREEEQALADKLARRRKIHSTVLLEDAEKEEKKYAKDQTKTIANETKDTDSSTEIVHRRSRVNKEKLIEKEEVHEDDILLQKIQEEDENAGAQDAEEEINSANTMLLKPVFVSKKERGSNEAQIVMYIYYRSIIIKQEEEIAFQEEEKRLKEKRKLETKMMLIEVKN